MSFQHRALPILSTAPAAARASTPAAPVRTLGVDERFAELGTPSRIWAIGAINGDTDKLANIHDQIINDVQPGDRLVYLGNYLGHARNDTTALDELFSFRRFFLAMPGVKITDIVYLRGGVEEMWQKLLQLQFCPNPADVLDWMEAQGIGQVLEAYGSSIAEARVYLCDRPMGLTKWTNRLRAARRAKAGHEVFSTILKRAAYTRHPNGSPGPLLFVHAGLDPRYGITYQGDNFWWGWRHLNKVGSEGYGPYQTIVRGYTPNPGEVAPESVICLGGEKSAICLSA
ncbi:MAG: hypothetical protein AB7G06_05490 [Bdellovibrionales bacterium]